MMTFLGINNLLLIAPQVIENEKVKFLKDFVLDST
jgi:hypothetical protein